MKSFLLTTFSLAGLVLAAGAARADDVRVIVGFKGEPSTGLVSEHGGRVHRTSGRFVAASLPAKALAKLRAEAAVAYVEEDAVAEAMGKVDGEAKPGGGSTTQPTETTPWGVAKVDAPGAWAANKLGTGVRVAVIDTGIDLDHPDLAANIEEGIDYVQDGTPPDDDNGHGSHVAGTIAAVDNSIGVVGVAPEARLYAVKVLDRRGSGWFSDVAAGIDWARLNADIANMSLGGRSGTQALSDACDNAKAAGVLLVCAAGNEGDGDINTPETSFPAAYSSCLAVGATSDTALDTLATWSNSGPYVWVCAPGVSIRSTYKGASYATLSGTSMASPHTAGMAALLWASATSPKPDAVRSILKTNAIERGPAGWDAGYGWGRILWKP